MMQGAMWRGEEYQIVSIVVSRFEGFQMVDGRIGVHHQHVMTQEIHILVRQVYLFDLLVQVSFELCLVFICILVSKLRFAIQALSMQLHRYGYTEW